MSTIQELNISKVPIVVKDKRLDPLDKQVLFPEKVENARQTIAKIGLPKRKRNAQKGKNSSV